LCQVSGGQVLTLAEFSSIPSFIIAGAQKCGTTALWYYLSLHPEIVPAKIKEIHFFCYERNFKTRGLEWYQMMFSPPSRLKGKLTFEASPNYLVFPKAMHRIKAYNPQMRIILILRNPTERAFSAWNHFRKYNREQIQHLGHLEGYDDDSVDGLLSLFRGASYISFEKAIEIEMAAMEQNELLFPEPGFLRKGLYVEQIKGCFKLFSRKKVLVLESNDLLFNTIETLDRAIEFLGLMPFEWPATIENRIHEGQYTSSMSITARDILDSFFREPNNKLTKLLGRDLPW
jgi:hypothetical protein